MSLIRTALIVSFTGFLATLAFGTQAFAYAEKTYVCANQSGVPNNSYSIKNINMSGTVLPYIEAKLHYRTDISDPNSPILEATLQGFALVIISSTGQETLRLANIELDFQGDTLLNCTAPTLVGGKSAP